MVQEHTFLVYMRTDASLRQDKTALGEFQSLLDLINHGNEFNTIKNGPLVGMVRHWFLMAFWLPIFALFATVVALAIELIAYLVTNATK